MGEFVLIILTSDDATMHLIHMEYSFQIENRQQLIRCNNVIK